MFHARASSQAVRSASVSAQSGLPQPYCNGTYTVTGVLPGAQYFSFYLDLPVGGATRDRRSGSALRLLQCLSVLLVRSCYADGEVTPSATRHAHSSSHSHQLPTFLRSKLVMS